MLIYGHRGSSATDPENTLRAFQSAIDAGADGLEFDLQRTADGVVVVLHDRNLVRTTGVSGAVDQMPFDAIRLLDAGHGERIPTFAEVLDLVGDRVHLDIEIKQPGIAAETLAVLANYPSVRWAISSFDWPTLEAVRSRSADAELWLLSAVVSDAVAHIATRLGASAVSLWHQAYSPENAERLASWGLKTIVWTVNDVAEARRCRDLGAAGICTDRPADLIAALNT